MSLKLFLLNGKVLPIEEAVVSISDVDVVYGFGVYETVKVRNNVVFFQEQHIERLFHSADLIHLKHIFSLDQIIKYISDLQVALQEPSYNLKLCLYGGKTAQDARLYIIPSAPLYPERKWYRDGVKVITVQHERWLPQAKSLNMLPSHYYYTQAKTQSAYDAVLLNRDREIIEGTRTNIYFMKGKEIFIPPMEKVLEGVTLMTILKVAKRNDYTVTERKVRYDDLNQYDSMFLSSTSTKIMPVTDIDDKLKLTISPELKELINLYEDALEKCEGMYELI